MRRADSGEIVIAQFNEKNRRVTNEHLEEIFKEVGQRYGYDTVKAEFVALDDFKIRWQRSYKWIDLRISDYLDRAPDEVLYDLADSIFRRVLGKGDGLGEIFVKYITDPDFSQSTRPQYLNRKHGLTQSTVGEFHDLNDSVYRLRSMGLIPAGTDCYLTWDKFSRNRQCVNTSPLMRTVQISSNLDVKGVPESVLDYCVYYGISTLATFAYPNRDNEQFQKMLARYPMKEEAEQWLHKNYYFAGS